MTVKQAVDAVRASTVQYSQAGDRLAAARLEFGVALRAERLRRRISLRRLARQFGIAASTLSDIERGRRWSPQVAARALDVLNAASGVAETGAER